MQIVEVVLYFAVCQFTVDQVAKVVVVIAAAVIFFKTIVLNGRAIVIGHPTSGLGTACLILIQKV